MSVRHKRGCARKGNGAAKERECTCGVVKASEPTYAYETFAATVALVDSLSADAFKEHVVAERRQWVWKVSRPGTWAYGYYLLVAPGAVIIYGDIGEAVFRMNAGSEQEALDWIVRCARDRDYTMSKLQNRASFREFYPGDALRFADGKDHELFQQLADLHDDGRLTAAAYYDAADEYGYSYEKPSCENWSAAAFWMAAALATFARFYKASSAGNA